MNDGAPEPSAATSTMCQLVLNTSVFSKSQQETSCGNSRMEHTKRSSTQYRETYKADIGEVCQRHCLRLHSSFSSPDY